MCIVPFANAEQGAPGTKDNAETRRRWRYAEKRDMDTAGRGGAARRRLIGYYGLAWL